MKTILCALLLAATASPALSQALAPELAPIATKYKADLDTLEAQRTNALAQAQKPYLAALANAEKSATTAGNVPAVSAITSERLSVGKGLMTPGFPPGMPKELQAARKTYLEAVERIRTAEAPRRQTLDGNYLRALTTLSAKAPKESELAKQIDAEKQKLMANTPSTSGKTNSKSVVLNGTFDMVDPQGRPNGWTIQEGFSVVRDGTNAVLHAKSTAPIYCSITQDILLPPRARTVTLSGRVRGVIASRDTAKSQGPPGVFVAGQYLDKNEQATQTWLMLDGGSDGKWKTVTSTTRIPDDVKVLQVSLVLKMVSGEFDFDDISVEFR